jgi:threonine dehydratase
MPSSGAVAKSCSSAIPTTRPTPTRWNWRKTEKLTFVHPFDDPEVIAGQGTIAMEILRQHSRHNGPIHAIFCCVGGGGLIAGVAAYIKRLRPEIRIIGVEAKMPTR